MKKNTLIIISGLGDNTTFLRLFTSHWRNDSNVKIHYEKFDWKDPSISFEKRLQELNEIINYHYSKKQRVSLLGTSAGGSAVINLFFLIWKLQQFLPF